MFHVVEGYRVLKTRSTVGESNQWNDVTGLDDTS